ncbi:hypothetical protein BGW38_009335 [Lunasporangiospora selenospora]|uniref:Uncharacterized protein n=1 Tax=Lunasporangiospora selenospora TaxID=979761 RepID=A0A9P6K952_9FUNG|nr:hypothetical protein BGW38_009335 [Lunasporangiospora selenospora]
MLAGNLAALFSGGFISVVISLWKPDNYTFEATRSLQQVTDDVVSGSESNDSSEDVTTMDDKTKEVSEKQDSTAVKIATAKERFALTAEDDAKLAKAAQFARWSSGVLTVVLILLWPLPMFFSKYVFSSGFYTGWIILSIVWAICSTIAVTIYPIWESRGAIAEVFKGIFALFLRRPSNSAV